MKSYIYNLTNFTKYKIFDSSENQFLIESPCTEIDLDRWWPDYGGCCPGLEAKLEPRPTTDSEYCPLSNANHGSSCWSTIVMCRIEGI